MICQIKISDFTFISHFKRLIILPHLTNKLLWYKLWFFNQNHQHNLFFKVIHYDYKFVQDLKPEIQNHIAKTFELKLNLPLMSNNTLNLNSVICSKMKLNLSLISNKALNLQCVICDEMNAASITNKVLF